MKATRKQARTEEKGAEERGAAERGAAETPPSGFPGERAAELAQAGAIAFRHDTDGIRVLLVTSRGSRRWVIPKGGIKPGQSPAEAAAIEAYEEAGVRGTIEAAALGCFRYHKRLRNGTTRVARVEVYALRVDKQLRNWPERAERHTEWVTIAEAAARLQDDDLAALLRRFEASELARR